jgi:hypothetical protein
MWYFLLFRVHQVVQYFFVVVVYYCLHALCMFVCLFISSGGDRRVDVDRK